LDEVGSTAFEAINQSVKFAWKNDRNLVRFTYGKTKDQPMEIYHWGRTVSLTLRGKF